MPKGYKKDGSYAGKVFTKGGKSLKGMLGKNQSKEWKEKRRLEMLGNKNPAWKGEKASYSASHHWIKQHKGIPLRCEKCGKNWTKPRSVQWANIDHKYRRNLNDWIPLCVSCHKNHDLAMLVK